eukprot:GILJ01020866.1.p1 GENE.GILJ01020866.1~~GILJ01020866.1.p1  ORF type:complete len:302 (-),score=53.93 GILJ01020866.1:169-1032(-)
MKGNSPVQTGLADGTRIGKSSELLGDGSVDATTTTGVINSAIASSPGRLPKLQTNNTNASNVNNSDLACGDRPRRETRSSSPPLEVSQQCRREILEMRAANKAEVEQQKEQDLLKHKELRHAVVTSHFNTFKSVKDLGVAKNSVVNQLRNDSQIRSKEREDLVKHIQKDKHDTFAKQKREQIELHEKNRYVTAHENRRRVLKENEEERKRVEIRNQEKEKELEDLRASADARRMIWSGSTPEHRRSAESQRERAAKGGNPFDSSGRRAVARGASRQTTDDGPVELFA